MSFLASSLSAGYYLLRLTVSNACGTTETDTSVVWVDKAFDSLVMRLPVNGFVLGESVTVDGTAWDYFFSHYTLEYRPAASTTFQPLEPGVPQYGATVVNDPLIPGGWDTLAAGIPDGDYVVRLRGTDQCGHTAEQTASITIDNTPPLAEITRPTAPSRLTGRVAVVGTATDTHLTSWTLEVTGGTSNDWSLLAGGTSPVVDARLTTWDTTALTPGPYTLRLRVVDAAILGCGRNHVAEHLVSVLVGRASPVLK